MLASQEKDFAPPELRMCATYTGILQKDCNNKCYLTSIKFVLYKPVRTSLARFLWRFQLMSLSSGFCGHFSFLRFPFLSLILALYGGLSFAQQPKVLAPHRPVGTRLEKRLPWGKPMARQSATGGLWMTDGKWKASLYLKNRLKTDPITVAPVLYLSNGQRYPLAPVTLEPSGTAIVDIGQGLESVGIAPYATLCGYAEIEYQWPWAAVTATVKNVDVVNSLIFIFSLQPSPDWHPEHMESMPTTLPTSFEGLWWKQEKDVSGFLALSNVTGQAIHATIRLTDKGDAPFANYQVTVSPHGTKMLTLDELKTAAGNEGGVYLTHDGPERGLDINGGLQDQAVGYSARLRMQPQLQQSPTSQPQSPQILSFSELGLMTGAADPMMDFPSGTVFTPYSLVRNISDQPGSVTPELWWMSGGSPHSALLPQMTILPHETLNLRAPALLAAAGLKNFSGSVNLILDTKAQAGGLLMSSGSVDQKNTYVFEVLTHAVEEGAAKELCYWSTGNGDDTMVTLWNPADEPQDLAFTLFYSGGQYVYPVHMEPRETRSLNVSDIVHSAIPDAAGNVIPAGITEGSAEIAGSLGEQQQILLSLDTAVYNVRKATCGVYCWNCSGVASASISPSFVALTVGKTTQETFYETTDTGVQYAATPLWTTSATNIATVNANSGVVSGVHGGSFTLHAVDVASRTVPGQACSDQYTNCPTFYPTADAPGTVVGILSGSCSGSDVTNKTQTVVVGQQIILCGSYALPSGVPQHFFSWSIPGSTANPPTAIANFTASAAGSTVTSVTVTQQSTTIHFVSAGNSIVVAFTLGFGNAQSLTAQTTYTVNAPSPASPTVTLPAGGRFYIDTLTGCTGKPSGPYLIFGNISGPVPGCAGTYTGAAGIAFSPPTTTTPAGTFSFVQLVNSDTVKYNALTCTATNTPGLDAAYPYQNKTGQLVNDAPFSPLPATYSTSSRNFAATMYLLWQSSTAGSIPVPIGSVNWSALGSTTQSNGVWGTPTGSGSAGTFTASAAYPSWTGVVGAANNNCH
jgi:hypothetical protein